MPEVSPGTAELVGDLLPLWMDFQYCFLKAFLLRLLIVCMCLPMYGGQRTTRGSQFSLASMYISGIELRSLGLATSAFTHQAILLVCTAVSKSLESFESRTGWDI